MATNKVADSTTQDEIIVVQKQVGDHPKRSWILLVSAAVILLIGILTVFFVYSRIQMISQELQQETFYAGIHVAGVDIGGKTREQAEQAIQPVLETDLQNIALTIVVGDKRYTYSEKDFNFVHHTDKALDEAFSFIREDSVWMRYFRYRSLQSNPKNFDVVSTLAELDTTLNDIIHYLAEQHNQKEKAASIREFRPAQGRSIQEMITVTERQPALVINEQKLLEDCTAILSSEQAIGTVTAELVELPYERDVTAEQLKQMITPFESYQTISKNTAAGNHNMALSLGKINGTILQPGEIFSFNDTVGQRTAANGFQKAAVIHKGRLMDDSGGGVCQASTTLYGAVLRAGIEIIERNNHSRPSAYVPIGQDAMVNWGTSDLRFKNNTEYPILIMASMQGTTLTVQLFGYQSDEWDQVEVTSWKTETISPGKATYVEDATLPKGEQVMVYEPITGARASAQRTYMKDGKKVRTEPIFSSYYRPLPAEIRVGTLQQPSESEQQEEAQ